MRLKKIAETLLTTSLLAACAQAQHQVWIEPDSVPSTRAELYARHGVPDAIRVEGEDRWLRYDHAKAKGMAFGARYIGVGLVVGRAQSKSDRLWIRVAPDDRITAVKPVIYSGDLNYQLWPFGD